MREIQAPTKYALADSDFSIFLAGSIEMGTAEHWQKRIIEELEDFDVYIFNPRRDDWDSSWEQRLSNPNFREQVEWELRALDDADLIIFYFAAGTKSPISLFELGLHIHGNIIVCCPDGFWRKGNIEIAMLKYGRPRRLFDNWVSTLNAVKYYLQEMGLTCK